MKGGKTSYRNRKKRKEYIGGKVQILCKKGGGERGNRRKVMRKSIGREKGTTNKE